MLIALIAIIRFASSIYVTIQSILLDSNLSLSSQFTASMVIFLMRSRVRTLHGRSERMINLLIVHTIESGAVTAIAALLELVFFLTMPTTFHHVCMKYILGRLFPNVLLATLNGRKRISEAAQAPYYSDSSRLACQTPIRFRSLHVWTPCDTRELCSGQRPEIGGARIEQLVNEGTEHIVRLQNRLPAVTC